MEEKLKTIGKAVLDGTFIQGRFGGSAYNACDLMGLSLVTLDALYMNINAQLQKQQSVGLLKKAKDTSLLEAQLNLVEAVFELKKEMEETLSKTEKVRKEKAVRLQLLKKAKEIKEIEAINNLSIEELDKELTELDKDH